jgi:hypothetical protein
MRQTSQQAALAGFPARSGNLPKNQQAIICELHGEQPSKPHMRIWRLASFHHSLSAHTKALADAPSLIQGLNYKTCKIITEKLIN